MAVHGQYKCIWFILGGISTYTPPYPPQMGIRDPPFHGHVRRILGMVVTVFRMTVFFFFPPPFSKYPFCRLIWPLNPFQFGKRSRTAGGWACCCCTRALRTRPQTRLRSARRTWWSTSRRRRRTRLRRARQCSSGPATRGGQRRRSRRSSGGWRGFAFYNILFL
jgi:hypothetical protein